MGNTWIVPVLALFTLLAVLVLAFYAKAAIDARRRDRNAPKSTLAKDGPEGGVEMLKPLDEQKPRDP